jgi:hypothetical protein
MGLADRLKRAVASNFFTEEEAPPPTAPQHNTPPATSTHLPNTQHPQNTSPASVTDFVLPTPVQVQNPSSANLTALQVAEMINALPESMPTRSKRLTVRAAIDSQVEKTGIKAEHLVAEATLNKIQIAQKLQQREAGYKAIISQLKKIMAEYEDEQANLQQQLDAYERVLHFLSVEVGNASQTQGRMSAAGIPAPFSSQSNFATANGEEGDDKETENTDENAESSARKAVSDENLPPHLRDGEVRKLLGIP